MLKDIEFKHKGLLILLGLCVIGFVCGTFYDLVITQTIYNKFRPLFIIFTIIGTYPFFTYNVYAGSFVLGYYKSNKDKENKYKKVLCIIIACVFAFFIGGQSVSQDGVGIILPVLTNTQKLSLILSLCLLLGVTSAVCGYCKGKKCKDSKQVEEIYNLMICLTMGFIFMQVFKNLFHRPRYRLILQDLDGIKYVNWYERIDDILLLQDRYGFETNEIRSFPSGHGYSCAASALVFSIFTKNKKFGFVLGSVFTIIVMLSRIVLGAHFLSDVCFGAIIGLIMCLIHIRIIRRRICQRI